MSPCSRSGALWLLGIEGVGRHPYSHHQATDHPGHHPAASGTKGEGIPQEEEQRDARAGLGRGLGGSAGTRGALGPPLSLRCAEPEEWGARCRGSEAGLGGTDSGARGGRVLPRRRAPGRMPLREPGVGLPPRRWAGPASARPGPSGLAAPGHRHRPRGGVCNSLESCTELRAAQPLGSGAGRRRSAAPGGRGGGEDAGGPPLKGRPASPPCAGARGSRSPPALARSGVGNRNKKDAEEETWTPQFSRLFPGFPLLPHLSLL